MRVLSLLILLLGRSVLHAAEVLFAGPEMILGSADLVPWSGVAFSPPAVASDGERALVVWVSRHPHNTSLHATVLDREGRPLTVLPHTLVERSVYDRTPLRILWTGAEFLVFYTDQGATLHVLRVGRDAGLLGERVFPGQAYRFDVAVRGEEIVLAMPAVLVRLRLDLSELGRIPLPWGADVFRIAAGADEFVLLTVRAPTVLAQTLRGSTLSLPVRIGGTGGADFADLVWTGSEYVAAWQDCFSGCGLSSVVRTIRLTAGLRPIGDEATPGPAGFYCSFCQEAIRLTSAGGGVVLLIWGSDEYTAGARLRDGVPLEDKPFRLPGYLRTFVTADGRLLGVSAKLQMVEVPLDGSISSEPLPSTPIAFSARPESLVAAAASPDALAVFRGNYGHPYRGTVYSSGGAPLYDIEAPYSTDDVAVASDGRDLYALMTGWAPQLQKLVPGAGPVTLSPYEGGRAASALAWTGSAFATVWRSTSARVELMDRDGRFLEPWCEDNIETSVDQSGIVLAAGGGELLLAIDRKLARVAQVSGDGCLEASVRPEDVGYDPHLAWNQGTWAAIGSSNSPQGLRLRFALSRAGEPFRPTSFVGQSGRAETAAVAGAGNRWLVLYSDYYPDLRAVLLDELGNELFALELATGVSGRHLLIPVSDNEVIALYTRSVHEPPYLGVNRVVMRRLTFDSQTRRRGVRH